MLIDTPTHDRDPIAEAEEAVKSTLDELQSLGVLQKANRMDLEQLLNPIEEQARHYMTVELSNQDICDAVLKAMASEDTNTNDHNDSEDEAAVRPRPTRCKALEAISVIQSYVEDIDSSYARKVEDVLATFGRQTRVEGMKTARETKIIDFFKKI